MRLCGFELLHCINRRWMAFRESLAAPAENIFPPSFSFFLTCVSRACLGKLIVFHVKRKRRQKAAFLISAPGDGLAKERDPGLEAVSSAAEHPQIICQTESGNNKHRLSGSARDQILLAAHLALSNLGN
eukprot:COSAG06_NODE_338_length_17232_cov_73.406584_17_plen_129_part_00